MVMCNQIPGTAKVHYAPFGNVASCFITQPILSLLNYALLHSTQAFRYQSYEITLN